MTVLTLAELNMCIKAEQQRSLDRVDAYLREEKHGEYVIKWWVGSKWGGFDFAVFEPKDRLEQFPSLAIMGQTGWLKVDQAPGTLISRYGEIKTAIELWIAGNGPWPEPREEKAD